MVCPISPKRGFRPLTLVRGAGYAIHKKEKLVTVNKNPKKVLNLLLLILISQTLWINTTQSVLWGK